MTVESDNNTSSLLRRIHGEEASGSTVTGHDATALMAAQQTLFDAGIDPGTLYGRAVDEIELSERLAERGITPPRRLWRMSDDEFAELDDAQLEDHLSAYGIDVPDMLSSLEDTVRIKNRRPLLGRLLDTVVGTVNGHYRPALAAGVFSGLLLIGGGATYLTVQQSGSPAYVAEQTPALPVVRTSVVDATSSPAAMSKQAAGPTLASVAYEPAVPQNTWVMRNNEVPPALSRSTTPAVAEKPGTMAVTERLPVVANADVLPVGTEPGASLPVHAVVSSGLRKAATLDVDAVTALATSRVKEFIFEPGDTLSHGLAMSGLPMERWPDIVDRVGTVFHPGDRAIFYFENEEFEQLVVVRRKNQRITVNSDLDVRTAAASATRVDTVTGSVQTSLFAALAALLDEKTAWRVSTRLRHAEVPLQYLPKGSTFDVRIERITSHNGETIGFGAIRGVRINAANKGTFTVGEVPGYSA